MSSICSGSIPRANIRPENLGDCKFCHRKVRSLKILSCNHSLCSTCVEKLLNPDDMQIVCPRCDQATDFSSSAAISYMPTNFFGNLSCDVCRARKNVKEMWWCGECLKIICSLCQIDEHQATGHKINKWNSLQGVKDCLGILRQLDDVKLKARDFNRQKLENFFRVYIDLLLKRIEETSADSDLYWHLQRLYGVHHTQDEDTNHDKITLDADNCGRTTPNPTNYGKITLNPANSAKNRYEISLDTTPVPTNCGKPDSNAANGSETTTKPVTRDLNSDVLAKTSHTIRQALDLAGMQDDRVYQIGKVQIRDIAPAGHLLEIMEKSIRFEYRSDQPDSNSSIGDNVSIPDSGIASLPPWL